jgi:hypothetical protein
MALADELKKRYTPTDWSAQYAGIQQSLKDALNAQYAAQKAQYEAQLPQIKQSYDAQRGNVYANARVNALGNNEALAARGLAGNAYASPMTGYSETSRIAETNALRNALNAAGLQQRTAEEGVQQGITQAGLARDQQVATTGADLQRAMLAAMQQENQFAANYGLQEQQMQEAVRQHNEQMAYKQQEAAYDRALRELQLYGRIVTPEASQALGYPVGTNLNAVKGKSTSKSSSAKKNPLADDAPAPPSDDDITRELARQMLGSLPGFGTLFKK